MKVHVNNILKSTLVATVGALVAVSPAFSATLTNGTFEASSIANPEAGTGRTGVAISDSTTITGWSVLSGNQGNDAFGDPRPTAGVVYLGNNNFSNNGTLSRIVSLNRGGFQAGISTVLTNLIPNAVNTVTVFFQLSGLLGNQPLVSVSLAGGGNAQFFGLISNGGFPTNLGNPPAPSFTNLLFENKTATFIFTTGEQQTSSVLSFTSQSGTNLGPLIDNVSLTPIPFEFSPLTGFIAGGVLFGSYKLIKRKKSVA